MFEADARRTKLRRDEFVQQARAARDAGRTCFQVYVPIEGGAPADEWLVDYETAGAVEALEAEGWTLENVAPAREAEGEPWGRIGTIAGRAVGTIYTFRFS